MLMLMVGLSFLTLSRSPTTDSLSLHDALPISARRRGDGARGVERPDARGQIVRGHVRSEEHTSELQSPDHLVCRLLLEKKNAMRQAHADGWFIVFDTLTLADGRLEAFYDNPNALRDYFRDIGRMVLAAEGDRKSVV